LFILADYTTEYNIPNVLKYTHESFCRDMHFSVPQFEFYFKVVLPKANKERLIMERDILGRIVKSQVPAIINYNYE